MNSKTAPNEAVPHRTHHKQTQSSPDSIPHIEGLYSVREILPGVLADLAEAWGKL